jgi:hypothetical protein
MADATPWNLERVFTSIAAPAFGAWAKFSADLAMALRPRFRDC